MTNLTHTVEQQGLKKLVYLILFRLTQCLGIHRLNSFKLVLMILLMTRLINLELFLV